MRRSGKKRSKRTKGARETEKVSQRTRLGETKAVDTDRIRRKC
jgi:hypothetical protein